ncbi:metallophosphoesterase [Pandoraea apista]|uniref:metallophosphoesterase n=1 Tax=Pandoraea apista TaxID=93218 RepID=UPI000658C299|nr:metallophosphoesterase [Pandoraea apista]ALS66687.1 serine/threonine protein phosphatase [Pandoraea apista]RRW93526.1 metallophosphoesterase [Pandoraea apista]RRX02672.1 metallophosphoesterase [Pandoraea apista]CFB61312.1 putative metallophosphoesterase [Pandoraea apista]
MLGLIALLHAYIGWRLLTPLPVDAGWKVLGGLWLIASTVLIPLGLMSRAIQREPLATLLTWTGMTAIGIFSTLFVLTLLRDLVLGVAMAFSVLDEQLVTRSAVIVLGLTALATVFGFYNARRLARVVDIDVPIANLPPELKGFTIVQLSDIHVSSTIRRRYIEAIVKATNELKPDLVAITGDLVDGGVHALRDHIAPLAQITSRHGTYVCTGNHEYYSGAPAWVEELRRIGLTVLENEHVVLEHEGASLTVAGVTDFTAHHFDPEKRSDPLAAIAGAPEGVPRVLLAHQPRSAPAAQEAGFDLQLSGHTHGGQFWPWMYFVPLQQPYVHGLHRLGRLAIYVSRGTGYWGPPKRFGAPSEITRLHLVPGKA